MGVYRALHELQLIPRLDAISSVSGGTWCSSIFMFARSFKGRSISTEELLGPGTKPSELSMEFLRRDVAPIASGIVHCDSDKIIVELLAKFKGREWEVWSHVMSAWLLRDFDELKSFDAYMASSEESVEKIRANNPELKESLFLTPRSDRPGTFIMVGTLRAPLGKLASLENVVLFQMSPDYTGNPFYPEDQQVVYDGLPICPCDACCYTCSPLSRTVGGGFVETFAFGGLAPSTQEEGLTEVGKPEKPFALPYAVAISSWAPANYMELSRVTADHLNQRQNYWPITSPILPEKQKALEYQFGDGGLQDVQGFLPLIQRQAKKLLLIANNSHALNSSYDWANATAATFDPIAAGVTDCVYPFFGFSSGACQGAVYSHDQVFAKELLFPLAQEIRELVAQGKPVLIYRKFRVLPNAWFGITGGWEVEFLLLYLEKAEHFEQQLPDDTRAELAKGNKGAFLGYPFYQTLEENAPDITGLTTPQVSLLAAQAEYSLKENAALLKQFLGVY
mmetsp:Transcript_11754/g.25857  ORF Transcript_11754/g.25857 Transcript_11754/m.25857 type:complete len:507 (-) Transcript_11754:38-1558(-)